MTHKKSRLPVVFIIFLTVSSCCKESYDDIKIQASNILVKNTYNFRSIADGVTINQQGYRIKCFLSDNIIRQISAYNDVTATLNYCEANFIGLKKDITNLTISCDKDIWNTLAGTPLDNNKIRFYENKFEVDSRNERLTIQEWLDLINNEDQLITFEWFIEFIETIDSTEFLKFQLLFELADNSEYITETESVKIE